MTTKYPHNDETKSVLSQSADFVQRDGLNYLISKWQRFADEYAEEEDLIYEWQNDLDTRKIIDEILATLSDSDKINIEAELRIIDSKVIEKTFEINECVWGDKVQTEYNYDRVKNWYYYRMNQKVFESRQGDFTKKH
ncbi:MAG: hypothetical protein WBP41_16960 [Saprospiraceae bacterium]